jgi:hypothetical protein
LKGNENGRLRGLRSSEWGIDTGTKNLFGTESYGVVCAWSIQLVKAQACSGATASGRDAVGAFVRADDRGRFAKSPDVDRFVDSEMEWGI